MFDDHKNNVHEEQKDEIYELQSMVPTDTQEQPVFDVSQVEQKQTRKSRRSNVRWTDKTKIVCATLLVLFIAGVSVMSWTSYQAAHTKNTVKKQENSDQVISYDSNNDEETTMDYDKSDEEESQQSPVINSNRNDPERVPQLRSYVHHKEYVRPEILGHLKIYIRKDAQNNRESPRRLRFPAARYDRRRLPIRGPFRHFLRNVPMFADRLTKQTIIYSQTSDAYIIPPLVNNDDELYSIAELIASGYASLVRSSTLPTAPINMISYFQPTPLTGPHVPRIYHSGFKGGLRTNFNSFYIPKKYKLANDERYNSESEEDNYEDRPYAVRNPYYKKPNQKPVPEDSELTTTGLQSFIDQLIKQLKAKPLDAILYWNSVTLQACANDYDTAVAIVPDQVGPTTTSRAFAIIHGAMYEAVVAFDGSLKSAFNPTNIPSTSGVPKESGTNAAIMEAAYQTLYTLYPKQRPIFDAVRRNFLKRIRSYVDTSSGVSQGIAIGQAIAVFILNNRADDGSATKQQYRPINEKGFHQVDPLNPNQGFLGVSWGMVRPFFLTDGSQFRSANNPGMSVADRLNYLNSVQYANEFEEVKAIGRRVSANRTLEQEETGIFWAYDGSPKIGVPPRLFNQAVRAVAMEKKNTLVQNARLFAMVNFALADASIAAWDSKYLYKLWRPIIGIRNAMNNPDPTWEPLGSPASSLDTDFTPNFPSFISGHSAFGSACFETLRLFYGSDETNFMLQSDEFNGKTIDSRTGQPRRQITRTYKTFTEPEQENFNGRIFLGVHWRIDQAGGQFIGRSVAQVVFDALGAGLPDSTKTETGYKI